MHPLVWPEGISILEAFILTLSYSHRRFLKKLQGDKQLAMSQLHPVTSKYCFSYEFKIMVESPSRSWGGGESQLYVTGHKRQKGNVPGHTPQAFLLFEQYGNISQFLKTLHEACVARCYFYAAHEATETQALPKN